MKDSDAIILAERAAQAWGGLDTPPRLVRNRENIVFDVTFANGQRAALRLHRAGYQTRDAIEAELAWTQTLSVQGFPCPLPVVTAQNEFTHRSEVGPIVSAVTWIDADPVSENGVQHDGEVADHCALYCRIGALIRQLHDTTQASSLANLSRPSWGIDALVGPAPHWGPFWTNPSLTDDEAAFLQTARTRAALDLAGLDQTPHLIHADLLQENILTNDQGLWLIDFDDSGYGFLGYDLGTALIQHAEAPHLGALSDALLQGYGADADLTRTLPLFIMLRAMASCGWIISRAQPKDPRQRFYAERALTCAARFLQTTTSISV